MPGMTEALARRALERSVAQRQAGYVQEVQRIVDATYRLIERTGGIDPSLRDVLAEASMSTQAFYRYFTSKDELMLALLDDGRRRLLGYLDHRMSGVTDAAAKVRAWIEGVLAQAASPAAAARTRPFVAHQDRLAEAFPQAQQESVDLLVDLLEEAVAQLPGGAVRRDAGAARRDAEAVYRLTFATLHDHLARRARPSAADVEHLVGFALRGLTAPSDVPGTTVPPARCARPGARR